MSSSVAQAEGLVTSMHRSWLPHPLVLLAAGAVCATVVLALAGGLDWTGAAAPGAVDLRLLPAFAQDPRHDLLASLHAPAWAGARPILLLIGAAVLAAVQFGALLRLITRLADPAPAGLLLAALLLGLGTLATGHGFLSGIALLGGPPGGTQIAAALLLVSVVLAVEGRLLPAVPLLGLACAARFEVGLWGLAALAGLTLVLAREGRRVGRAWLIGLPLAALMAAPAGIAWWHGLVAAPAFSDDAIAWLQVLAPHPYFAAAVPLPNWILLAATLLLGIAACAVLRPDGTRVSGALAGFAVLAALGCVVPELTRAPAAYALRLMAADGLVQVLAAAVAIGVVLRDLLQARDLVRVTLAVVVVAGLVLSPALLPLAALAMLGRAAMAAGELLRFERWIRPASGHWLHRAGLAVLLVLLVAGGVLGARHAAPVITAGVQPGVVRLIAWARHTTKPDAEFLLGSDDGSPLRTFASFAHRRVWQEADHPALPLEPGEMVPPRLWAMRTLPQRLRFACRAGVDYVAGYAPHPEPADIKEAIRFEADGFFAVDESRYCSGRHTAER